MFDCEFIELDVHSVEHVDDTNGRKFAADAGETDHVREEDGDGFKQLRSQE